MYDLKTITNKFIALKTVENVDSVFLDGLKTFTYLTNAAHGLIFIRCL